MPRHVNIIEAPQQRAELV